MLLSAFFVDSNGELQNVSDFSFFSVEHKPKWHVEALKLSSDVVYNSWTVNSSNNSKNPKIDSTLVVCNSCHLVPERVPAVLQSMSKIGPDHFLMLTAKLQSMQ